ncbi:Sperm mitochondrial-associated cysteine-rich protein [Actinidia chinensis var. chinensis]|uniref:Sperm mitochondrial-associated cysteine-rich protein n=1 Tax=Actinidia chinensis var. chinensis TaxID=1590841 RepID=A0A2R6R764_ACTCC|nr:Sperm mitochondrial-associated cysteine-rich protein [Actinidia chinensis var. chinensis]
MRRSSEREKSMEDCMRECMRKLGLWYTRNFKPIMTHEELEPIMATRGFVPLPSSSASAWKEYVYCAGAGGWPPTEAPPPRPRLPYPRIDGLHIYTYTAFLDALDFYLNMNNISDLFHIRVDTALKLNAGCIFELDFRGMPLHRVHDRRKKWRRMEEDSIFVHREGALDQEMYALYHKSNNEINSGGKGCISRIIRNKGTTTPTGRDGGGGGGDVDRGSGSGGVRDVACLAAAAVVETWWWRVAAVAETETCKQYRNRK